MLESDRRDLRSLEFVDRTERVFVAIERGSGIRRPCSASGLAALFRRERFENPIEVRAPARVTRLRSPQQHRCAT